MKVFLDTETTHLFPGQIAQLSYIVTNDNLEVVRAVNRYFAVDGISSAALAVHRLTEQRLVELSNGRAFRDHFLDIRADLADHLLIAHNCSFDFRFLLAEYRRLGHMYAPKATFCTMKYFAPGCKIPSRRSGGSKWPKLQEVMTFLGISAEETAQYAFNLFGCKIVEEHDSRFDVAAMFIACLKAVPLQHYTTDAMDA